MPLPYSKIGLLQTSPLPGDFSANLRAIVQGYRDCINHGAEIVLAPADALCGICPGDLSKRASFLRQMRAAFDSLSHELCEAPLLTCGYASAISEEDLWDGLLGEEEEDPERPDPTIGLVPFLIEKDTVTELDDGEVNFIDEHTVFIGIGDEEMLPDTEPCDLMVHFGITPWHTAAVKVDEESRAWEARTNGCPVAILRPVGLAGHSVYGGGSAICSATGKTLLRLPFFRVASAVADMRRGKPVPAAPTHEALMRDALELGIRDMVRQHGYGGVCLPLDHPNSTLLAALAVSALGSSNVCGITFCGNTAAAKTLGIDCCEWQPADMSTAAQSAGLSAEATEALARRSNAALMQSYAESRGLMLLSPLDRHAILTGDFTLYGDTCGALLPLGNLYRVDIYLLSRHLSEEHAGLFGTLSEPGEALQDRILHELADLNIGASDLLQKKGLIFPENDVRFMQRRLISSALRRTQLPTTLRVDPLEERIKIPTNHRLND